MIRKVGKFDQRSGSRAPCAIVSEHQYDDEKTD